MDDCCEQQLCLLTIVFQLVARDPYQDWSLITMGTVQTHEDGPCSDDLICNLKHNTREAVWYNGKITALGFRRLGCYSQLCH